jgi:CO/xanthine dehydrogenase Mo-binding subunit
MATFATSSIDAHRLARCHAAELRTEARALLKIASAMCDRSADLRRRLAALHRHSPVLRPLGLARGASDRPLPAREAVWRKLSRGELPWTRFQAMLIGRGSAAICAGCDERIAEGQVRVEAEFTGDRSLLFHADCFVGWHSALTAREQTGTRPAIARPAR